MDNKLVLVGEVVRAQGIKGKLKVRPFADTDIFFTAKGIYLGSDEGSSSCYEITASQLHKGSVLLSLEGVETMNKAEELVGSRLFIEGDELEDLPEGEYYWDQIIGLDVVTDEGRLIGKVYEIFPTGSNDVYVVRDGSKEYLIPAIEEVVREIDIAGGRIVISPIKGLLGDE